MLLLAIRIAPVATIISMVATAGTAHGQYADGFEGVNSTPFGTPLSGQAGWYTPPIPSTVGLEAYTYTFNSLGIITPPTGGGARFAAGSATASNKVAQHAVTFGSGGPIWNAAFDFFPRSGPLGNIAGFSLQPAVARTFTVQATWAASGPGATWDANVSCYDAAGVNVTASIPNPAFQGLPSATWFRWQVSWRFDTNELIEIRLVNLSSGATASYAPAGWYLSGGAASMAPLPTDIRFTIEGNPGNTAAFDNLVVGANPVEYQVNQPQASLRVDGETNDWSRPIRGVRTLFQPSLLDLYSTEVGFPWDVAVSQGGLFPVNHGGLTTPNGQNINVALSDPTFAFLNGGTFTVPFIPFNITLVPTFPIDLQAQMAVVTPAHPDGFAVSAPNVLHVDYAEGQHFVAPINPAQVQGHQVVIVQTPAPTAPQPPETSNATVPLIANGQMRLFYTGASGFPVNIFRTVQVDNSSQQLLHNGTPVTDLSQVFTPPLPASQGFGTLDFIIDVPISLYISGLALSPLPPCFQTDVQWLPPGVVATPLEPQKVTTFCDGRAGLADFTPAQADALLANIGLAHVISTGPPSDAYDCHGWTFTGGAKWINNDQVQKILDFNCYSSVAAGGVMAGDLVVYRDAGGNITHTGIVTAVDVAGNATEVESKWGALGRYRHSPSRVPASYGTPAYHRTTRAGGNQINATL